MAGTKQDSTGPEESKLCYNLAATVSQNCRSLIGIRVKIFTDQVRLLDQAAVVRSISYDASKHHLLRAILLRDGVKQSKWKFKMVFAIRRHFFPHFFSFAIESYKYETDFTLQKCHFYCQLFSHDQSHLNYYIYII